jgi:hypothetical protein
MSQRHFHRPRGQARLTGEPDGPLAGGVVMGRALGRGQGGCDRASYALVHLGA